MIKVKQFSGFDTFPHHSTTLTSQEYERAVIFRLGRLLSGGARGPGSHQLSIIKIHQIIIRFASIISLVAVWILIWKHQLIINHEGVFFIIPCVDIYEKIDMRTQTFDVPPQEVIKG